MTFDLFTVRSNLRSRNWENIDRSFPLDIVKANGGNLQCMIEAVKRFNKNNKKKNLPGVIHPCPRAIYKYEILLSL